MQVSPEIAKSGLTTIDALRDCIKSDEMYLNPALYNLLCAGVESGKLKNGSKTTVPSALPRLLTEAHEAHIRLELFLALKRQRYGKNSGKDEGIRRKKMWEAFCEVVHSDRERNASSAEKARREAAGNATEDNAELLDDDDADNVKPLVNNNYF